MGHFQPAAHAELVSEADFIKAQNTAAPRGPRGPAAPAARRYLLAGLPACGRCGRRLESAWSNGKPAYRCRHGHTSAASPDPGRAKTTYVHEDQVLPHLAAIAVLLAGPAGKPGRGNRGLVQVGGPADTAALIDRLRADGVVLAYDPGDRTLGARALDEDTLKRSRRVLGDDHPDALRLAGNLAEELRALRETQWPAQFPRVAGKPPVRPATSDQAGQMRECKYNLTVP